LLENLSSSKQFVLQNGTLGMLQESTEKLLEPSINITRYHASIDGFTDNLGIL
jgi:hypothetical protein